MEHTVKLEKIIEQFTQVYKDMTKDGETLFKAVSLMQKMLDEETVTKIVLNKKAMLIHTKESDGYGVSMYEENNNE